MAVCERAGLAGVLCRMLTQPTPAVTDAMSQLARIAAGMSGRPGGKCTLSFSNLRDITILKIIAIIMHTAPLFTPQIIFCAKNRE